MRVDVLKAVVMAAALAPGPGCRKPCGETIEFEWEDHRFDRRHLANANNWIAEESQRCVRICATLLQEELPAKPMHVDRCSIHFDKGIDPADDSTPPWHTGLMERRAGTVTCSGQYEYVCPLKLGRHPLGIRFEEQPAADLAETLARFAADEHAAVLAFEHLAARLTAWGAPADLVRRCQEAADQERNHATLMQREATLRGARIPMFEVEPEQTTLLQMALNNAREGCANESAAALHAYVLARSAPTASLRAAFAQIAVDEAGHAELSFDLHGWFLDQLGPDQRSVLEDALAAALAGIPDVLGAEAAASPSELGFGGIDAARRAGEILREQLATHS